LATATGTEVDVITVSTTTFATAVNVASDISTFYTTTTSTQVVTVTPTFSVGPTGVVVRRAAAKTPLSRIVSSSFSADRITSACNCLNIAFTTTIGTATLSSTIQTTSTTYTTTVATFAATNTITTTFSTSTTTTNSVLATVTVTPKFALQVSGTENAGQYLQRTVAFSGWTDENMLFTNDITAATTFSIDSQSRLAYDSQPGQSFLSFYNPGYTSEQVFFNSQSVVDGCGTGCAYVDFTIDLATFQLSASNGGVSIIQICSYDTKRLFFIGNTIGSGCTPMTLTAVYV